MTRSEADRRVWAWECDLATRKLVDWRRNYDLNEVLSE
jgi:hypothetical protein